MYLLRILLDFLACVCLFCLASGNNWAYSQTRSSVAIRLSCWHLFDKFLISFVNCLTLFAYQTQKAWNRSLSTTEFWRNLFLKFDQNLGRNKIYLSPIRFRESSRKIPPTSNFEIWQTNMQRFSSRVHACSENLIGPFQTGSHQTNQKLSRVATLGRVWL